MSVLRVGVMLFTFYLYVVALTLSGAVVSGSGWAGTSFTVVTPSLRPCSPVFIYLAGQTFRVVT